MKKILRFLILNYTLLILNCFAQQPGWEIFPSGTTENLNSIHFIDPFDLYICGDVFLHFVSTDSGITWQVNSFPASVTLNDIFVIDQNTIVTVGNSGTILRTTDAGNSWNTISSGVSEDLISVSFADNYGICCGSLQTILYSSDSGASWSVSTTGYFGVFSSAFMLSPQYGFVAGENSIFEPLLGRTTDSGLNWDYTVFYLNNNEGSATGVDFTDLMNGYTSASVWDGRGAIAKTIDNGFNWTTTFFSNLLLDIDFPISNTGLIGYAVGDGGSILKTYNAGMDWQQQQSGTILKLNKVHFLDFDYGFVVGENGIILRTTTGGEPVTSVKIENESPLSFQLYQNYPNPFNATTKIKFIVPDVIAIRQLPEKRSQLVTLIVYDILGNEIATLVNEEKPAGEYEVEFNPESSIKYPATGIYFYQLSIGDPETSSGQIITQTRKMVLLK